MNEGDALFEQAASALRGAGGKRDLAAARELFRRSAEAGRSHAAVIHANFVAAGVGAPPDWQGGLFLLRSLAETDRRCRGQLDRIDAMALTPEGDPAEAPAGETLCEHPHIARFTAFFTPEECLYLASAAAPMLEPSVVVDAATGRQVRDPVRTSDGIGFPWPLENPAIHALNRRIAAASGTHVAQGEPLQVLRYKPGDQYRTHYDAIPGFANQRILTMIVWLNQDYEGGETFFPTPNLKLRGRTGDALLFRNAGSDGRRDPDAAHSGLPVTAGQKWIASRWIRQAPFELPIEGAG
ncbi:MAG TPA: 2OG-Fe(II) oxygenase [Allosphingosinicella sp.]|nr:2OG-Fe(II) oxygenase [Allosphingosinicella sp.]